MMAEEFPKKKRGRPPKSDTVDSLGISTSTSSDPDSEQSETEAGHKLMNEVMNMTKITFLLEKPDVLLFGLYDYYEVIDQPLWLGEVFKKFNNKEYTRFCDITTDIKLVLENSCRFWGRGHKFIKQALRVEKVMNRHVKGLPDPIKTDGAPTDGESVTSSELPFKIEDFHSEILEEIEKKHWKRTLRAPTDALLAWEREMFESKMNEIRVIPELAEIGQFLFLAKGALYLKKISQYEVERMLLLCRESLTLANIMTSLLCPTALRTILYNKPVMVYEVWSSLLRKKMDTWYNAYTKCNDRLQMFLRYGIEISFWDSLGEVNPFMGQPEFEEMSLAMKATILKALCDVMFHSNKKLEDSFNAMEENKLRNTMSFEDSKYKYYAMFNPEIRVYRAPKNEDEIMPLSQSKLNPTSRSSDKKHFYLVAWNKKSLGDLIRDLSKKKKSLSSMQKLLTENENEELTLLALQGMKNQCEKTKNNEEFIESSINYWLMKTFPSSSKSQDPKQEVLSLSAGGNEILDDLGVRRFSKRKLSAEGKENRPWYGQGQLPCEGKIRRSGRRVERLPSFPTDKIQRLQLLPTPNDSPTPSHPSTTSLRGRKRRLSSWLLHLRHSVTASTPHRKAIDILRAAVERSQSTLQTVDSVENVLTVSISATTKSSEEDGCDSSDQQVASRTPLTAGRILHIPVVENASEPVESGDILCIDTLQHAPQSVRFRGIEVENANETVESGDILCIDTLQRAPQSVTSFRGIEVSD